jgi:hypothetical protein
MDVEASTQWLDLTQQSTAMVLGVPKYYNTKEVFYKCVTFISTLQLETEYLLSGTPNTIAVDCWVKSNHCVEASTYYKIDICYYLLSTNH